MKRGLQLGAGLTLPLDAVTGTSAFVGNKGMGKTNGMIRFAEQAIQHGQQVVTLDPTDAHWGLKYGQSKGAEGLPVYVLGGFHGDADLEPTGGALMADVVVESRASFVLSLRKMSKTQMRSFVAAFLERLYFLKGDDAHRNPTLVVMDEAHLFAPEGAGGDALKCLGAVQDVALLGRSSGLGIAFGTQRTAALSKSVLEVCEFLVAFRATGTNTRKALLNWVSAHDVEEQAEAFFGSIAGLEVGEAWAWSPGWLRIFQRVQIHQRETFDSSATPKVGQRLRPRGKAAVVDLAVLGERMAETVERQQQDDPKRLHAEISRLKGELEAERSKPIAPVEPEVREVVREVVPPALMAAIVALEVPVAHIIEAVVAAREHVPAVESAIGGLRVAEQRALAAQPAPVAEIQPAQPVARQPEPPRAAPPGEPGARLDRAQRAVLTVLVHHGAQSHDQLALQTGYSVSASTVGVALSRLRSAGFVTPGSKRDLAEITDAGRAALGPVETLPTGAALLEWWRGRLGDGAERKVMDVLVAAYPAQCTHDELADATGYRRTASTVGVALSRLRSYGISDGSKSLSRAREDFMRSIEGR